MRERFKTRRRHPLEIQRSRLREDLAESSEMDYWKWCSVRGRPARASGLDPDPRRPEIQDNGMGISISISIGVGNCRAVAARVPRRYNRKVVAFVVLWHLTDSAELLGTVLCHTFQPKKKPVSVRRPGSCDQQCAMWCFRPNMQPPQFTLSAFSDGDERGRKGPEVNASFTVSNKKLIPGILPEPLQGDRCFFGDNSGCSWKQFKTAVHLGGPLSLGSWVQRGIRLK